ncbi:unnamed protein product, partial [Arabidopsis halleri]
YLAPKYAASGKLTEKSDVFSFCVVIIGRRPVDTNDVYHKVCVIDGGTGTALLNRAFEEGVFRVCLNQRWVMSMTERRWLAWLLVLQLAFAIQLAADLA